jgi:hypothetical protein
MELTPPNRTTRFTCIAWHCPNTVPRVRTQGPGTRIPMRHWANASLPEVLSFYMYMAMTVVLIDRTATQLHEIRHQDTSEDSINTAWNCEADMFSKSKLYYTGNWGTYSWLKKDIVNTLNKQKIKKCFFLRGKHTLYPYIDFSHKTPLYY